MQLRLPTDSITTRGVEKDAIVDEELRRMDNVKHTKIDEVRYELDD
jgi:hypothetical protein